ncbi:MAG: hypothetical protein DHS20C06_09070 [Hyphobacterium sp.]|nr:MAG: hypothetical protein DHS20C06_09070 [Hyphobacterium sp.]
MAFQLIALALLQTSECGPLTNIEPPAANEAFLYQSTVNGEDLDVVQRIEIIAAIGLSTTFRQGGGLSAESVEMAAGAPIRGFAGPTFPRSAGSGNRHREWSYSPSPDDLLETLSLGENRDIYVRERNGATGDDYVLNIQLDRCEMLDIDGQPHASNVYVLMRNDDDGSTVSNKEVWLSSATGWWLRESNRTTGLETIAVAHRN